ncbi:ECF RNA polymerase sigma factor SigW [Paenibacillus glycanilyticus]|uniref:ECF RNA polymerase sigma factor SigW n=1 Tax=Paenibacillus glycanilyticus TaxID=126569 RepID=A0ABQ6NFR4_9BACL|nr:sigma-70 family RNA polymerase sigma factor [Paenibacillus glycanilyticus]GMK43951.1 ECF RNA polymerase sigma factor SigW [Paenibacillus glycanilyticus]
MQVASEELKSIILQAKSGDQEAYATLVKRYKGHVYRHALGMLGDRMDAEDAAQEAFIKAFYSLSSLDSAYAFSSWILRITSNLCKDRLKKRAKALEQELKEGHNEDIADPHMPDALEKVSLADGLGRISADHREVLLLHEVQGYSYEEIAAILEVPIGTVKSRLFAARINLRNELRRED